MAWSLWLIPFGLGVWVIAAFGIQAVVNRRPTRRTLSERLMPYHRPSGSLAAEAELWLQGEDR